MVRWIYYVALAVSLYVMVACKGRQLASQQKDISVSVPSLTCTAKWACISKGLNGEISDVIIRFQGHGSSNELDPDRCESLLKKKLAAESPCAGADLISGSTTSQMGKSSVTMVSEGSGLGKRIIERLEVTKAVIKRGCYDEDCQGWINEIREQAGLIGGLAEESAKLSSWCADGMLFELSTYGRENSGFGFCDVRFTGTMSMCQDYAKSLIQVSENIKKLCPPSQRHWIKVCPALPCRY